VPKRTDVVAEQLNQLAGDLENLWLAITRDPKKQARRERAWMILSAGLTAGATMATRRILAKVWPILTGEPPPTARPAGTQTPPRAQPSSERETETRERATA
jgi:hypothetical protein